jgi:hypothetical protein
MVYFSHNYHTEEPTVQMYISPCQFSIVNENTKQVLNDFMRIQRQLICPGESFVHVMIAIQDKQQRQYIAIQQSLCSCITRIQHIQLPLQCFSWCQAKLIQSFEEYVLQSVYLHLSSD